MKAQQLLDVQKRNLAKLEAELYDLTDFKKSDRYGHGGTPIVDNSVGRMRRRQMEKHDDQIRRKVKQVEEQKEKIRRTEGKIGFIESSIEKAQVFIDANPIHEGLFKLQAQGKVKQWTRKPHFFFVVKPQDEKYKDESFEKVALFTLNGRVCVNGRYRTNSHLEFEYCKQLISEIS